VPRAGAEIAGTFFLFLAYSMKETTVVVFPAVIGILGLSMLSAFRPSRAFKWFAVRHVLVHAVLAGTLLISVWQNRSGAYVAQNYQLSSSLAMKVQRSWMYMTLYSDVVPYLIVGGGLLGAMLLWVVRHQDESTPVDRSALGLLLVSICLCAGFWVVNVPWGQPLDKYYLPSIMYGCVAGSLILQLSARLLWRHGFRAAGALWLVGSLFFLLRNTESRAAASRCHYIQQYGHCEVIPRVVEDIAASAMQSGSGCRAHIVAGNLFQEGALPFQRWLNRFHRLNIAVDGRVVSKVRAIERNYFRRYAGEPAVEVTLSDGVSDSLDCDRVYFVTPAKPDQVERLSALGFILAGDWTVGKSKADIWKYARK